MRPQCALRRLGKGCSGTFQADGSHSSLGRLRCKYSCWVIGRVVVSYKVCFGWWASAASLSRYLRSRMWFSVACV